MRWPFILLDASIAHKPPHGLQEFTHAIDHRLCDAKILLTASLLTYDYVPCHQHRAAFVWLNYIDVTFGNLGYLPLNLLAI